MKKLAAISLVLGLVGWVAACSQGDTHPPMLGDCTSCGSPLINVGGGGDSGSGDAAKDVTSDVAQDSTSDASQDAPSETSTDTGPLDTGTGG